MGVIPGKLWDVTGYVQLVNEESIPMRRPVKPRLHVVKKRTAPRANLLSIRDSVRLAAPVVDVLRKIGQESIRNRTDTLSSRQIDRIIKAARTKKSQR
jgi:hypothetical protein